MLNHVNAHCSASTNFLILVTSNEATVFYYLLSFVIYYLLSYFCYINTFGKNKSFFAKGNAKKLKNIEKDSKKAMRQDLL